MEGIRQRESSRTSKTILVAPRTCAVTTREVLLYKSRTWYIYALPFAHASRVCIYRSPYLRWCVLVGCWLWFGVGVFCVCLRPSSQGRSASSGAHREGDCSRYHCLKLLASPREQLEFKPRSQKFRQREQVRSPLRKPAKRLRQSRATPPVSLLRNRRKQISR